MRRRSDQVSGFLLRRGHFRRAVVPGRYLYLAQRHRFLSNEIGFVSVVIFLLLGRGDHNVAIDLFADHALNQDLVLIGIFQIFETVSALFADPFVEFLGIGNAALPLNLGDAARNVGFDVDVQFGGLRNQQQLIDLIAQCVGGSFINGVLQRLTDQALLFQLSLNSSALFFQFAAGNDFAIHLRDNLFHDTDLRVGTVCGGE